MNSAAKNPATNGRTRGWWKSHRFLLLRRTSQLLVLALFLAGPLAGLWILRGNLAASRLLDTVPLADPFILLQSLVAGHLPSATALTGGLLIAAWYLLWGGRSFCSWVCPVNMVTDLAFWLRRRLNLKAGASLVPATRYWLAGAILMVSALTSSLAWEYVNPVTSLPRGLLFGFGSLWLLLPGLFLFDLLVASRGWCGHLCPVGAFYSFIGLFGLVRVRAAGRSRCTNCLACYGHCPEPQVIGPTLQKKDSTHAFILSPNCTNCGKCIDICPEEVFGFALRFRPSRPGSSAPNPNQEE